MEKRDSQALKTAIALLLLVILSLVVVLRTTRATVLYRTDSPHQRYRVEIVQRRLVGERAVYLDAYRDGEQTVRRKLLYTGDFLDGPFLDLYSNYSWTSESALRIGSETTTNEVQSPLKVVNESPSRLSFLLIEAGWNKIMLFDVGPGSSWNLLFPAPGGFTCQGEFAWSRKRLGVGASRPTTGETAPFEIVVLPDSILVKYGQKTLEREHCCVSDRPDFDHEWLY